MLWGDAEDKVICRFKNVTFASREGMGHVPLLAVGNVEKLLFKNCTFEGYTKPILLVGTDDMENIEIVRSGEMELKRATFEECVEAHPGGIALLDRGKYVFWDLKDPTAPPSKETKRKEKNWKSSATVNGTALSCNKRIGSPIDKILRKEIFARFFLFLIKDVIFLSQNSEICDLYR